MSQPTCLRNFLKNKLPVFDTCCRGKPLCLPSMQGRTQGTPTVSGITGKTFLIKFLTTAEHWTGMVVSSFIQHMHSPTGEQVASCLWFLEGLKL
ncbi:MAG: hypothetical protein D3923_06925 [Candidatus Electrothrix sp. AR3]|nr:hypothetical protein [Candidatus Electrothrix sp. AR3]